MGQDQMTSESLMASLPVVSPNLPSVGPSNKSGSKSAYSWELC
jgi:hypothetical protein